MTSELVVWLTALFDDLHWRAPHGITWSVDTDEPPLRVRVQLVGETSGAELTVREDSMAARIAVIAQVQAHVAAGWQRELPPCPSHGARLEGRAARGEVRWHCPHGDVACPVGDYDELLWPPALDDLDAAALYGSRLRRRGISGLSRWGVKANVVHAVVREGSDEAALRDAAAPLLVELAWIGPIDWSRRRDEDGETITITNASRQLARLTGQLGRSETGGLQVGGAEVHLSFDHQVGPPSGPLLLDADGVAFADEGDEVICGGGFARTGPVRGEPGIFVVSKITRSSPRSQT